jgi:hypothetical protein
MADIVDIAIPAKAQAAAEALGLIVSRRLPTERECAESRAMKPRSQSLACAITASLLGSSRPAH